MTEVLTAPGPAVVTGRRCQIEELFDEGFIELLQLAPLNPHVRALILKFTSKMPGPDCGTFEEIKEWVETNCQKRSSFPRHNRREDGIAVTVDFSDVEYGRADYSVSRSGQSDFHLGAEELMRIVRDATADGGGLDEIVEAVTQKIEDDAWSQCEPSMEDSGDYDYGDHEETGSESSQITYSKEDIHQALTVYLQERHPDLATQLEL